MLDMDAPHDRQTDIPKIARSGKTHEAPSFGRPLMNMKAKEGKAVKSVLACRIISNLMYAWYTPADLLLVNI